MERLTSEKADLTTALQGAQDKLQKALEARSAAETEAHSLKTDMTFLAKSSLEGTEEKVEMARREVEQRVLSLMRREVRECAISRCRRLASGTSVHDVAAANSAVSDAIKSYFVAARRNASPGEQSRKWRD